MAKTLRARRLHPQGQKLANFRRLSVSDEQSSGLPDSHGRSESSNDARSAANRRVRTQSLSQCREHGEVSNACRRNLTGRDERCPLAQSAGVRQNHRREDNRRAKCANWKHAEKGPANNRLDRDHGTPELNVLSTKWRSAANAQTKCGSRAQRASH